MTKIKKEKYINMSNFWGKSYIYFKRKLRKYTRQTFCEIAKLGPKYFFPKFLAFHSSKIFKTDLKKFLKEVLKKSFLGTCKGQNKETKS